MGFFDLNYPLTRTFQWRYIGPLSFAGAFVVIGFLTIVNVALVGYETVTVFQSDYNVTQAFWYNTFMPYRASKPGTLCGSRVFNVGDTFTTTNAIFAWSIQAVKTPNAGVSGVSYKGLPLNDCDIAGIYITGDLRTWSIDFSVMVNCINGSPFDVTATTSFKMTSLPGTLAPLLGYSRYLGSSDVPDGRPLVLDRLIRTASEDVGERISTAWLNSNGTRPVMFSLQALVDKLCPASLGNVTCATQPPKFHVDSAANIDTQGSLNQDTTSIMDAVLTAPIFNLIQTVYAATRIDFGIDSPNNFILHKEAMSKTLNATFPVTSDTPANSGNIGLKSHLYSAWMDPKAPDSLQDYSWMTNFLPVNVTGPTPLQVVYLCQFQQKKSRGSLFISVLVATLSMFTSGWAIYLTVLTGLTKSTPESNHCEGHLLNESYAPTQPYRAAEAKDPSAY